MASPLPALVGRLTEPFLPTLARTGILAVACNVVLELAGIIGAGAAPWFGKSPAFPLVFVLDVAVTWLVIGLVHAVVGSIRVTAAVSALTVGLVAVVNFEKVRTVREPLYPGDWAFAGEVGFLAEMVGGRVLLLVVLAVLVAAVIVVASTRAARGWVRCQPRGGAARGRRAACRAVTATLCLVSLVHLGGFNSPGNAARETFELFGAEWVAANPQVNYLRNGFVGGYLSNLAAPTPTPPGYSPTTMARIANSYQRVARRANLTRDPDALDDLNVVLVLSESFTDPLALKGLRLASDPIPFVRGMTASTTAGTMLSQSFASRTANMEFETLTGMSLSMFPRQVGVPYNTMVPDHATFPSAVARMKAIGHRAVAIHPNGPQLYRRRVVYRTLGFDEFRYDSSMRERGRIGNDAWISDEAAFEELMLTLETEEAPSLVHLVTMQNHMPYAGRYDDPVGVLGPEGEPLADVGQYVRGLAHSDRAVEDLVRRLAGFPERTVLVFYGDHLPGVYPASVIDRNTSRARHQTPFFVWANFPGPVRAVPTTSPVHFLWLALERANAPVAPYDALLHELWQEVPAMDAGLIIDSENREIRAAELSPRARRLLRDYRLVQYDLSVGERYAEEAMFAVP